ncbi:hypothetical protein [Caldilinea sp.]|uniref:hypothetical protein n=1 Tax=Caldilinea sp. TaxID=2293560 RepID=UPI0021DE6878|nr:hypothetical protein [Caldilinea sp.]GIV73508.1 MAG: hypothetical protein KatS3mg049_2064 [Caldilinea sp.]
MVHDKELVVKMADEQQAVIKWSRVELQDARTYSPRLVAVMNLEDAIILAKAILAFAGEAEEVEDGRQ